MIAKHSFGTPVICKQCGQAAASVWAETWDAAQIGEGVCQTCFDLNAASEALSATSQTVTEPAAPGSQEASG